MVNQKFHMNVFYSNQKKLQVFINNEEPQSL